MPAFTLLLLSVADMVPVTGFSKPDKAAIKLLTLNVAVLAPAATVTEEGNPNWLEGIDEERLMVNPPAGAGPLSVTVPVALPNKFSVLGDTLIPVKTGAVTVTLAETDPQDPSSACTVAVIVAATGRVATANVAEVAP